MVYGIYRIINLINHKIYIGSTGSSLGFNRRWIRHKSELKRKIHSNSYLQNSWNKYGENNFIFEIVCICNDENLIEFEDYYMRFWNTMNRNYGYNLISACRNIISEETRKKLVSSHLGIPPSNKGKHLSEETKAKMRSTCALKRKTKEVYE